MIYNLVDKIVEKPSIFGIALSKRILAVMYMNNQKMFTNWAILYWTNN